jgi:hypothetical protein
MTMIEGNGVALGDAELQFDLDELTVDPDSAAAPSAHEVAEIVDGPNSVEEGLGALASLGMVARPVDPNPPKRQLMISLGFDMVFHADGTIEHVPHWVPLPD